MREKRRLYRRSGALEGEMGSCAPTRYNAAMPELSIRDFHAHIYYNPEQVELAKQLAAAAQERFSLGVGHFQLHPGGPHPRGSVQLTVPRNLFGEVAQFLALNRGPLTVFAHAETGNALAD